MCRLASFRHVVVWLLTMVCYENHHNHLADDRHSNVFPTRSSQFPMMNNSHVIFYCFVVSLLGHSHVIRSDLIAIIKQANQVVLARETSLGSISSMTVTSDGVVHVADDSSFQVLSAIPFIPAPDENLQFTISNPASNELYIFNKYGQHVLTKNAISGQVVFTFIYDVDTSFGKLSAVVSQSGARTSFLRDNGRNLASIETASGQKCRINVNGQGLLEKFIDPENLTTRFFYEPSNGLMTTRRDSSGFNLFYKYDSNGRLIGVIADSFRR